MELPEHPRRRNRSSLYASAQSVPATPFVSATNIPQHADGSTTAHERHTDLALGFVDIYQSLTPRQIGVIGLWTLSARDIVTNTSIAVGSAIGTGLMIGTARALTM